ncbi:sigma-70 family RNA polymerase sigma factor [Candidatus Woesearchaeota archaeon]|nr:sigma-70 family RNA polymerase sigma factor [Candidatus Woesearchaeota archaeon]
MDMYISEEAVARLLESHDNFVWNALRLCGEWNTAEDLVQEAYIRVIRSAHDETRLSGYMTKAIRSAFKDMLRKNKKKSAMNASNECDLPSGLDCLAGAKFEPGRDEISPPLLEALSKVPDKFTTVFLDYVNGLNPTEISLMRGLVRGTVNTRIYRTKKQLRETLKGTYC